ncbi:N-acyl-D-amino-acid deacylase family protein [Maribacter cobaltidurans]|uniref:Aminoacylase n=1 Tax=Maribacter cobaltidurans TaxID=1178778 RepID=A0A223V9J6_9FLAO|nr:D-aminoacylase [Maribacter cobaltidurans]ASV31810.1 aminoacylase [Maribacter cobaltidurans]GGD84768.1 aminoacylase [Maribacter cobaltidurans]
MKHLYHFTFYLFLVLITSCTTTETFDILIKNGQIADGTGQPIFTGDIGINADTIAAVGNLENSKGLQEFDATGLTVAPGFINMLSWATESLIVDGKSESDIRQGVTLEVMGEGWSMGPLNDEMRQQEQSSQKDVKYPIEWTTLGEYLEFLEKRGIAPNVASFVGATTLRVHELGEANRPPTPTELENMKALAKTAMEEGAMGIGSSLIYAPAFYADTEELIELCKVASAYDGMYISHMRSEGDYWLEAIDELIRIAKEANIPAEIYHLKAGGKDNWGKWESAIAKIDSARFAGLQITTDMYNYTAGATGLDASMPPWVQEGGYGKWAERLQDPAIRKKVIEEMKAKGDGWENLYFAAGSPEKLILNDFRNDSLRYLTGKTLGEVARMRGTSPEETAIDLVVQDSSRVGTVYFLMSEENVKKQIALPYMSFGSDAGSLAPVKPFTNSSPHPRAYGNVARLLGKYVREEKVIPLEEAVYKLSGLPASNLKIKKRGSLAIGNYADLAIFDANTIMDKATFDEPHQFAEGMVHVFVNGEQVLKNGEHTGVTPGRVVRGPGWRGHN